MKKYYLLLLICCYSFSSYGQGFGDELHDETNESAESNLNIAVKYVGGYTPGEFNSCADVQTEPGKLNRESLRTAIDQMQAYSNILRVAGGERNQQLVSTAEQKLVVMQRLIQQVSLCQFQEEIQAELASIGNEVSQNKQFLEQLNNITTCINVDAPTSSFGNVLEMAKSSFDSIFSHFWNKSQQDNLTQQDCEVLRKTYSVWASFYDAQNDQTNRDEEKIPLYNVNPHNSSYYYWMQERNSGRIPPQGLALMHVDTHTDLGHIHAHSQGSGMDALPFTAFDEVFDSAARNDREGLVSNVERALANSPYPQEQKDNLLNYMRTADFAEITSTLNQAVRTNVHQIAQPIMGAVASGVTSSVTMVLPPWTPRLEETTNFDSRNRAVPLTVNMQEIVTEDSERILGPAIDITTQDPNTDLGALDNPYTPLLHYNPTTDSDWSRPTGTTFGLTVSQLTRETESAAIGQTNFDVQASSQMRPLSDYLPAQAKDDGFILDIDLDAFVSNGRGINRAEPVSYGRTQNLDGDSRHNRHSEFNELDQTDEVLTTEMQAIKQRIDVFFDRLAASKEQGFNPKVITIADSTTLMRAIEGQENDSAGGGNFTPSCMAFLLNYMVRQKLSALYNVDIK